VSESALSSRIKSARQAIGDNGQDQRLIRTIHGRGFRFVGEVHDLEAPSIPAAVTPATRSGHPVLDRLGAGEGVAIDLHGSTAARRRWVDELQHAAETQGLLTARGRGAAELRPYASVLEALDEVLTRRPDLLEDVPGPCRIELESALAGAALSSPQRLLVSVRELLGAAGRIGGIALVIEDAHLVERATLELLQHVARGVRSQPVVLVVTRRSGAEADPWFELVELDREPAGTDEVPGEVRSVLTRIATLGETVPFEEALAAAGLPLAEAQRALDVAVGAGVLERHDAGLRFTEGDVADALRDESSPARRAEIARRVADHLVRTDAEPHRIADRLTDAGDLEAAGPYQVRAAQVAAERGHHHEVLRRTDAARQLRDAPVRRALLELRGDALGELGDPEAVRCYREVLAATDGEGDPWLRARLARALVRVNDVMSAREALASIDLARSPHPGVRLVGAMVLYLCGDVDQAEELVIGLRDLALTPGSELLGVISVLGMVAHSRGEWFDRLRLELRHLTGSDDVARTLFDAHLCVTQYLLYGPSGHAEVIALAEDLRRSALELGSEQAAAFAGTLEGEARLLSGDLAGARRSLEAAVAGHRATNGDTGLAHSLQRLAEVNLYAGEPRESLRLLQQALPIARWSPLSHHLLQRIYGTMVAAAPTPEDAALTAADALAVLDGPESCDFCQVMVAVPATIAFARVGRLEDAREQLEVARKVAARWEGPAWPAAVDEAAAALARADGDEAGAVALLDRAARGFDAAGQPLDAERCREAL
jgi:hypothetical protein